MSIGRGWLRRLKVLLVVCTTSVALAAVSVPSATAGRRAGVAPAAAAQAGNPAQKQVPVQQLANRVEKLIRTVEGSTLACDTRNALVRRLRILDDALLSGRRSAAQAFALAWARNAWSLESARVLDAELGSTLQRQLGGMVDQIGTGWSVKPGPTRHWKPLPACGSGPGVESGSVVASSGYTPFAATDVSSDVEILVGALVSYVPLVGNLLYALTYLLWPAGSTADSFSQMATATVYKLVEDTLNRLHGLMDGSPGSWDNEMAAFNTACPNWSQTEACVTRANGLFGDFRDGKNNFFIYNRSAFEVNTSATGGADYRLDLLPLFAQYENLYMGLLHDAMLLHDHYWSKVPGLDDDDLAGTSMAQELDPTFVNNNVADRGIGYVDSIYSMGLSRQPSATSDWRTRNEYIRNVTLSVLDAKDTWKYMDPRAYPDGVPGGVKLTRMIYTFPTGHMQTQPTLPVNVAGPLKEVSVWTKPVTDGGTYVFRSITSAQATNPPLLGPAQSGPVTGLTSHPVNAANYFDLRALGPISEVKTQSNVSGCIGRQNNIPSWVGFYWAKGGHSDNGSWRNVASNDFHFDGEVLATVKVVGTYNVGNCGNTVGDSVLFGFRYADSFQPSGEVIGVGSGKCLDVPSWTLRTQAVIRSCGIPPAYSQTWAYDPGLQQISVTNADGAKHCLDAAGGSTARYTPVIVNACDDGAVTYDAGGNRIVSSQRWQIDAVGASAAKIVNVRSNMAIEVANYSTADGAGLILEPYVGDAPQQWRAHDPSTGEIHGIGSGRCVDVPDYSTTPGTQVQIYDCHGNAAQQWTYRNKQFVYARAPSLCLEARGGGTTMGTAVQINTCTGALEQQWTVHGDGYAISNDKSGLVLDVPGGSTANNTLLQLATANGTDAQQWSRTSTLGGALHSVAAGRCLDLPSGSDGSNGTRAVIRGCAGPPTATQTWTYHPIAQTFTVDGPSGVKCLDAAGGGTATGTAVLIADCSSTAPGQRWERSFGYSTVTNVHSGLVLDLTGGSTADGTTLELTAQPRDAQGHLLPATSSQKWVWSLD